MEEEDRKEKEGALAEQIGGDHYRKLVIQPVELIRDINANFFQGNVIKYVTRYKDKNGIKDLEKAKHYLELMRELKPQTDTKLSQEYLLEAVANYSTGNNLGDFERDIILSIIYKDGENNIPDENIDIAILLVSSLINKLIEKK